MRQTRIPDQVRAIAEGPSHAHIATILPAGSPHSVPVWVGVEGDWISVLTSPGSRKARNMARDPGASISMPAANNLHSMAQARGRVAARIERADAWQIIDRRPLQRIG